MVALFVTSVLVNVSALMFAASNKSITIFKSKKNHLVVHIKLQYFTSYYFWKSHLNYSYTIYLVVL